MRKMELLAFGTRLLRVEGKDDEIVRYLNSEADFGSLRIVKDVDSRMYIGYTEMEDRHR